ncbi:MAG: hypothetical protein IT293_00710 [Deltaproteobacteria bacterium]|nr:hypothetical protein [Deltaproteobacteria bacterium]
MDVFLLRDRLIGDYADYVRSFIAIRDPRIREQVDRELDAGRLWPNPHVVLDPSSSDAARQLGAAIEELR